MYMQGNNVLSENLLLEILKVLPSWIIERTSGWNSQQFCICWFFFSLHCFEVIYLLEQFESVMFGCLWESPILGWKQIFFKAKLSFVWNSPTASCPLCSFAFAGMSKPRLFNILPSEALYGPLMSGSPYNSPDLDLEVFFGCLSIKVLSRKK